MLRLIVYKQIRAAVNACLRSLRNEPAITKSQVVRIVAAKFPGQTAAIQEHVDSVFKKRFER